MTKNFYVYAYLRKDNTPYYVGKGKERRAYSRNRVIKPPKDRKRIVFLRTGLTEDKAFEWEKFYIGHYGRIDTGTGILRNLTDGGEGTSGWVVSEEFKEKMRKNNKAREASKSKRQKSVELTRMLDGEVFVYDCVSDAARALNLGQGNLSAVCRGERYSVNGYLARYWSPSLKSWGEGLFYRVEEVRQKQENARKNNGAKTGEVNKLRLQKDVELTRMSDGEIFVFDSLNDAARALGLVPGNLCKVCNGKRKSHKGYTARYLEATQGKTDGE